MVSGKPHRRHRRAIILYSLAIIIPGMVLSIMAYRGFQENRAMLEKKRNENLSKIADDFFQDLESTINIKLNTFSDDLVYSDVGFFDFRAIEKRIVFREDNSILTALTYKTDSIYRFLQNSMLFMPERRWDGLLQKEPDISRLTICLEEEFENHKLVQAQLRN